jgi:hypothetical protein
MNMQCIKRQLMSLALLIPVLTALGSRQVLAMGQKPPRLTLTPAQQRLQNMGLVLVVDAVEGAEMLGTEFFADGNERPFYASSVTILRNRAIMAFPSGTVPEKMRVIWREKNVNSPFWWAAPHAVDDFGRNLDSETQIKNQREMSNRQPGPESAALFLKEKVEKRKTIAANLGVSHQGPWGGEYFGPAVGDYTFHAASRIPDDVVKEIRKNGGGLRLKFRLHPDGVLFGWDIERISGGLPRHSMAGGDFREADLAYELPGRLVYDAYLNPYTASARLNPEAKPYLDSGKYFIPPRASTIWRRGWYIHPKTSERIETDF